MSVLLSVLMLLAGETIALKEKASVAGRWVRVLDLLDASRSDARALVALADLYVGRAPEEGRTRTITADEIRREMERRGLDPAAFAWSGDRVEVVAGRESAAGPLRTAIAFELKRKLLEGEPGLRADEVSVRVLHLNSEPEAEELGVLGASLRGAQFTATLESGAKVDGVAQVLRARDAAVAAREIPAGRVIERSDLEFRRLILGDDETAFGDAASLVGSTTVKTVRKDALLVPSDLRMKSVVRKGDVVRVVSSAYEVDARALEEGAPGQEIGLEFATTRGRVRAKVVSASRVELVEAGR